MICQHTSWYVKIKFLNILELGAPSSLPADASCYLPKKKSSISGSAHCLAISTCRVSRSHARLHLHWKMVCRMFIDSGPAGNLQETYRKTTLCHGNGFHPMSRSSPRGMESIEMAHWLASMWCSWCSGMSCQRMSWWPGILALSFFICCCQGSSRQRSLSHHFLPSIVQRHPCRLAHPEGIANV